MDKILPPNVLKFIKIESFSGILLLIATLIALIWANSPLSHLYESLWQSKIGISTQLFEINKPLILWINDGLMTIFFFVIGLEIKRELIIGELNTIKKAAFPFFAAFGGMIIPLSLFFILNKNPETSAGWGIPMATDIAFTLAILNLLGKRVPVSLKIFLTAFAIVDDLGAVIVIAVFYSSELNWIMLAIAMLPLVMLFILSRIGLYSKYTLLILGIVIWYLFLKSGIHPTIAGVLIAFAVPIRQKFNVKVFVSELHTIVKNINKTEDVEAPILTKAHLHEIDNLENLTYKVQSPLQHLEHKLHNWVAYLIMPLFALANAGVAFSSGMALDMPLVLNITIALVVGKFIGVSLFSFLGVKLKLADLPENANNLQILGIAVLAGLGFTMSIFIANLAFAEYPGYIDSAKVGILAGSLIAGILGYFILKKGSKA